MPKEKHLPKSSGGPKWLRPLVVLLGLGALGTGIAWAAGSRRKKPVFTDPVEPKPLPQLPVEKPVQSKWKDDSFPLGYRSRGPRVVLVQKALNRAFGEKLTTDGLWGDATEAAMQRAHRVNPRMVPAPVVTQAMYANLQRAFSDLNLSGPSFPVLQTTLATRVFDPRFGTSEVVAAGQVLGEHLETRSGTSRFRHADGAERWVSTSDTVLL